MGVSDTYELNEDPDYPDTNKPELTVVGSPASVDYKPVKRNPKISNVFPQLLHTSEVQKRYLTEIDYIWGIRTKMKT